jgi:prepilin-type N-terminal cleavage/methylation domain-containing protein
MLNGKRGFTLLEIVMVMAITAITLPVVGTAFYMLLKVPADETAKLSVLNDVNLALNWIHEDVNRGQFFAGDPAMLRSITTVDFATDPTNQSAWDKLGEPVNISVRVMVDQRLRQLQVDHFTCRRRL